MLTFGQSLGFLETGEDLHGMVKLQKAATYYAGTVSLSHALPLSILASYMWYKDVTNAMA
jgi:hypothetical protein